MAVVPEPAQNSGDWQVPEEVIYSANQTETLDNVALDDTTLPILCGDDVLCQAMEVAEVIAVTPAPQEPTYYVPLGEDISDAECEVENEEWFGMYRGGRRSRE